MGEIVQVINAIAPLFVIIFVGVAVQKIKHVGDEWLTVLNGFALNIGLPALIFSALSKAPFSFDEQASLILLNSAFIVGCFIAAVIVGKMLKLNKQMFRTLFICLFFGNISYLGIPILTQVLGEGINQTAVLIVAIYLFWLSTVGIGYLDYSDEKDKTMVVKNALKNLAKNQLLIAVVLGIIVGSLHVVVHPILKQSLDMLTASVTPVVLIVIGIFVGRSSFGKLKEWYPVILFAITTLLLLPACFYFGLRSFGFSPELFPSSILEAAMPLAITPFALADKYDLNKTFIARSIVLSTIFSILSIPLWVYILGIRVVGV
jgi:hypothetical protein